MQHNSLKLSFVCRAGIVELRELYERLNNDVNHMNNLLLHHLRKRDRLSSQRTQYYDIITAALQAISPKRSESAILWVRVLCNHNKSKDMSLMIIPSQTHSYYAAIKLVTTKRIAIKLFKLSLIRPYKVEAHKSINTNCN